MSNRPGFQLTPRCTFNSQFGEGSSRREPLGEIPPQSTSQNSCGPDARPCQSAALFHPRGKKHCGILGTPGRSHNLESDFVKIVACDAVYEGERKLWKGHGSPCQWRHAFPLSGWSVSSAKMTSAKLFGEKKLVIPAKVGMTFCGRSSHGRWNSGRRRGFVTFRRRDSVCWIPGRTGL